MTSRTKIIAGVAVAIALVVFGFCERRAGKREGAINQEIKASAAAVQEARVPAVVARQAAAIEVKKSVAKRPEYRAARAKIEVKGDTVISDGQSVVLPSLAAFVKVADAGHAQDSTTIDKQARSDTLQNVLVGALDHHVDLLEKKKDPRIGFKTGVAIGVVTTVAVVYGAVKIIKAVAHR